MFDKQKKKESVICGDLFGDLSTWLWQCSVFCAFAWQSRWDLVFSPGPSVSWYNRGYDEVKGTWQVMTLKVCKTFQNIYIYINKGLFTTYVSPKGGGPDPPSPFVSHCQYFPQPPSLLCQPLSAFPQPPPPPFVSFVSSCQTPPPFSVSVLWTYLMPPSSWITYFFWKKVHYLTKIINMSSWVG